MILLQRLATLVMAGLTVLLCGLLLLCIEGVLTLDNVAFFFDTVRGDQVLIIIARCVIVILLLQNFIFYQMASAAASHEKVVAFDNPSGRVSVSISAIEDLVKRTVSKMQEVKDVRANISVAKKKGLNVVIRIILGIETNIPHLTSKIQDYVAQKIQDVIGLQEPIHVEVNIVKIVSDKTKLKKNKQDNDDEDIEHAPSKAPYHGYRA